MQETRARAMGQQIQVTSRSRVSFPKKPESAPTNANYLLSLTHLGEAMTLKGTGGKIHLLQ